MISLTPFLGFASSNHRLVEAFSTDEVLQLNLLHDAVARHSFALDFGPYGHLVFNMILLLLRLDPGPVTEAHILYVGRTLGLLFAAATALLTFSWAQRAYGTMAAWIAFSLLLVNRTLYVETAEIKPDLVQLFFLMLALWFVARLADESRLRWLTLASAAAGLAFAAKYSGLFVLPLAALALIRRPPALERERSRVVVLRVVLATCAIALLAASTVFNVDWIASHLTSDGRIDSPLSGTLLAWLTMATRAGGIVAAVLAITPWCWTWLRRWKYGLALLWSLFMMAAVFAATFVAVSPYSLREAAFIKGMFAEASFAVPSSITSVVGVTHGIGVAVELPALLAALATLVWVGWTAWRKPSQVTVSDAVLSAWVVVYVLVLMAPIHEFYVDYALPLAPAVAMLAGRGVTLVTRRLGNAIPRRQLLVTGAMCLVVAAAELLFARDLMDGRDHQLARAVSSDQALVAKWLECRAPASARIAYDHFVYVPPVFPDATATWGGTRRWLSSLDPDIVIVNGTTADYVMGHAESAEYYRCLAEGSCGYEPVLSRGDLTVYGRRGQLAKLFSEDPVRLRMPQCS